MRLSLCINIVKISKIRPDNKGSDDVPIIFEGNEKFAYRDPTCYYYEGNYHLFFTISEKENGYMYNRVAHSVSKDLRHFTSPEMITEKDHSKNFCSPGNARRGIACVCLYQRF